MDFKVAGPITDEACGGKFTVSIMDASRIFSIGATKLREAVKKGKLKVYDPLRSLNDGIASKGKRLLIVGEVAVWIRDNQIQTTDVDAVNPNI